MEAACLDHQSGREWRSADDRQPRCRPDLDKFHALRLRIERNGKITVINERNGFNKSYQAN